MSTYDANRSAPRFKTLKKLESLIASWKPEEVSTHTQATVMLSQMPSPLSTSPSVTTPVSSVEMSSLQSTTPLMPTSHPTRRRPLSETPQLYCHHLQKD